MRDCANVMMMMMMMMLLLMFADCTRNEDGDDAPAASSVGDYVHGMMNSQSAC
jgi:hypothetical protein